MKTKSIIELLESRIAPAVFIVNASTATYTDIDGDHVTVKVSTGTLTAGLFTAAAVTPGHDQLQLIDFSGGGFDNANLTVSVAKAPGGDGLAHVGFINSTGHDLGVVNVKGDLGQIDAGNATTATPGLKSLAVQSLGRYGLDTQAAGGSLKSDVAGALGKLTVKGDIAGAFVLTSGGADGKIGAVTIGGSLIGGSTDGSGLIFSSGDMGAVKIGRDVQGGSGPNSGFIKSNGKLAGVTIGGSLFGGSNYISGHISSLGAMGAVKIGHDVLGGSGVGSGLIASGGKLTSVSIGGSLIGGSATNSGAILSGDLGVVKIGHDLMGGSIGGADSLDGSGCIESSGRIGSVTIGGSIISGIDSSSGGLTRNASIRAGYDIGTLTVKGSLIGNSTAGGASLIFITARGQIFPGATTDVAIGKLSIGGRVEFANILAGYDILFGAVNGDAQIGAVSVGGDWVASNLVAGVSNTTSFNTNFGDTSDLSIGAGTAGIIARIAKITIGGQVVGSPSGVSTTDHFGFSAQQIGSFKSLGFTAVLHSTNPPPDVIELSFVTGDVTIREV